MFKKTCCYVRNCVYEIKNVLFSDKRHFFIALVAFVLGFLIAVGKDYGEAEECVNFFYDIIRESGAPIVSQTLRVLLWTCVIYLGVFITSSHFVVFTVVGYGGIALGSYLIFSNAFEAIAVDTLCGSLYFVLYLIPTIAVTFLLVVCALRGVYMLLNFSCNRKLFTNFACSGRSICRTIEPYFCINVIFSTVYFIVIYAVLVSVT